MKTETNKEMVNEHYRYRYTPNGDGTISVKYNEIIKMLDKKPLLIMGQYDDEDGYENYIWTEFEDLIKKCVIGKTDMFGKSHRLSLDRVKQIIENVYYENGWDEIYDYEEVER